MDRLTTYLTWAMFGGVLGWLTNIMFDTQSVWFFANIFGGICGAYVGVQLSSLGPIWETPRSDSARMSLVKGIPWAATGAAVMVLFVNVLW